MKSLMGDLTILDNIIHSNSSSYEEVEKAKKIHRKILGNYSLTKTEQKYLDEKRGEK